jgi:hypothetical protein
VQDPALWELRYAIGAYSFALVLGAFNLRALAVVPTAIGYLSHAARADDYYVTAMYAGQAMLLIAFAGAGTEAMSHIYRTTLQQLLTRQDLAMLAGQDAIAKHYDPMVAMLVTSAQASLRGSVCGQPLASSVSPVAIARSLAACNQALKLIAPLLPVECD